MSDKFLIEISTLVDDHRARRNDRNLILLLGAGADISSGGMTFRQFKQDFACLVLGKDRLPEKKIDRAVDAYFESTSEKEIRARLVKATFDIQKNRKPSEAYLLLALTLEKQALDAIITTNFDTMLESAEQMLGLSVLRVFAEGIALPASSERQEYEPNRVPYLKLHGCLNSRTITRITTKELLASNYRREFRAFLNQRLARADLIIAGYGGYDSGLASLISDALKDSAARIYWCNPTLPDSNAPLVKKLSRRYKIRTVTAAFDKLVEAIARPVLAAASFTSAKPIYIPRLLGWRTESSNSSFIASHAYRRQKDIRGFLVKRRSIETQLSQFLEDDRPMTIITGPSGMGKSALALRLVEQYKNDEHCFVLIIPANTIKVGEGFGEYLASQLAGLGSKTPFSFAEFEPWLRGTKSRFIVYLDALNEHAASLDHVATLLRDIVRFCYFLQKHSAIRVVVSVRQETWNRLSTREDRGRLAMVCWNPTSMPGILHTLQLGALTDPELEEALGLLCQAISRRNIFSDLPPQAVERLRDPYLLAAVSDEVLESRSINALNWVHGPSRHIYSAIFKTKLERNFSDSDVSSLATAIARVAFLTLERGEDQFRAIDVAKLAAGFGSIDLALIFKDLGILVETEDGRLRFAHERTQEYFLARALELPECELTLRTVDGLAKVLREFDNRHQVIAAVRTYFLLDPAVRFRLVADIVSNPGLADQATEQLLIAFAKELMVDLAGDSPVDFRNWFNETKMEVALLDKSAYESKARAAALERHWRAVIQAAAHLPETIALQVLTEATVTDTTAMLFTTDKKRNVALSLTEANIYATDKLVRLLLSREDRISLMQDAELSQYYADPQIPRLRRLGRVLGLMSQIGPDNTHPNEYSRIRAASTAACKQIMAEGPLTPMELDWFANFIFEERDRYVFNGDLEGMQRFFRNPARAAFLPILDHLENGHVLRHGDVSVLQPYIAEIYQDLEFQLGNFLFIFSAGNNFQATKNLWEEYFDSFNNTSPPNNFDFFQAVAPYMYVVNGYPYDNMLDRHIDRVLRECPAVLEYEPGRERGFRRGYTDEFDMVFEDGFNPIASYATLLPSQSRRKLRWQAYVSQSGQGVVALPVYETHLAQALQQAEIRKAMRILHALSQFITLWPREGLWSMVGPFQYDHPTIHRAVVRVLAEAYNRYPVETLRFFANSGISISPGDMRNIRARIDPRTGRRQFEGLQWGRVLHFLMSLPDARANFFRALRITYKSPSASAAVYEIADGLGWTK